MSNGKNYEIKNSLIIVVVVAFAFSMIVANVFCVGNEDNVAYAYEIDVNAKSVYLTDLNNTTTMYCKNENAKLPIASMVKIMTALLTFEAIENGDVDIDEKIVASENAACMGGSQVFLDAGCKYQVRQLLKSVIVASANDSCVALAERIAGSVSAFVEQMNDKAIELNMKNTHFANCTGLPAPDGFSCAKDVAIMFAELIHHPTYFEFSKVWLEDFEHPSGRTTTMTNTNKLIRQYNGCDGGKTGFTSEAKFCLAGTAERNGLRTIAVVIGADSSLDRFNGVKNMFDYAFANYKNEVLVSKDDIVDIIDVPNGKIDNVAVCLNDDVSAIVKKGDDNEYKVVYDLPSSVKAPVNVGDNIGKAYLTKNGEIVKEYDVISCEFVERANILDIIKRITGQW